MTIRNYKQQIPDFSNNCYIDDSAVVIGKVQIGENSSVWPLTVIRGDVNAITIGKNTNIQDGSVLHVTHDGPYDYNRGGYALTLGNNITVGHSAVLHGCKIDDNCLIGMGSIIMDGAVIGSNVILAAGSLVSPGQQLDSGYLYIGRPAEKFRPLTEEEIESIQYSASHYVELKNTYSK